METWTEYWRDDPTVQVKVLTMDSQRESLRGHLCYRTETSRENWRDDPKGQVKGLTMASQKESLRGHLFCRTETSREHWRDDWKVQVKALTMDSQTESLTGHQMGLLKDTSSALTTESWMAAWMARLTELARGFWMVQKMDVQMGSSREET